MKSHTKVVVIGGGVVGCSVLYHLTKFGWTDVVLLERSELTSGSTWHAAGGMHTINGDPNVAKLQKYTVELYKEIQEYSGQDIGLHMTSGLMLAATPQRFDWLKSILAKGRYNGLEATLLSPKEAHEMMPLLDPDQFVGALYDPVEGHLDPYGTTHAYAKSAKKNGADIYLHTKVEDLVQREDGCWRVITNQGEIIAEHVVNCGGLWAREVGRMVGIELPVLAMEHMYLITEDMKEVTDFNAATGKELMHCVDFDGEIYLRQERQGMLMGTYEKACRPWSPLNTPWDFGHELLAEDIERITPELEVGFRHFPAFNNAGIKKIINGPFTFSPDGNPLVGRVRGMTNYWSACAVMAGFSQGGGVGLALANWMIYGDPGFDVFAMDVSRYGDYATLAYTNAKVRENYQRRFSIRYPNEELPAGRPLLTTPIYDKLKAAGGVFGAYYGLEQALWFAPAGEEDAFSWRRSNDFDVVGAEAKAVRESVGMMETSGFAKYTVTGAGAEGWLDGLLTCRMPAIGRMTLAPMLKDDGKLIGDFTLAKLGEGDFLLIGSGVAESYHMRWFEDRLPNDGSVELKALGLSLLGLSIAGPNARKLLEKLTHQDISDAAFPFMEIRRMDIGMAPAIVGRVSYTGDLGYELWMKPEYQNYLFDLIMEAGKEYGIGLFGLRALNALRLEKSYGSWSREYRPLYGPYEAGLGRFVALSKGADFVGKQAAAREKAEGGSMRLKTFILSARDADVIGDEPIYYQGEVKGWVTSGGFAHGSGVSVALGYVPKEIADETEGWSIELLSELLPASLQSAPLFDADGSRMRS
ncbi:FAD-dependent oxidoreductase [Rhizobium sp. VS19-DR104.2]|uniref:GcvT family protein n=1 Tax=unclassified Rhizobium TaxID=2613769 RepID=UPI001C5AF516|nr:MULTISPECIES: FAD-dependent oxidoreductase [unclassified Rhizobium]MBZ5758879.1 FAD-dependent oxidoreductase [Rhizobium sp. VS19-DR96]MBZ5764291.1 FAD-dependent oxidoreductase [Rhizobium sp. VS19-DR129.2]MBZ5771834.1 FAD-dependent oxidoreductase [Rhizobium sp. VS19-DRK62.2]MBZ5783479.1 FAD-dependent oxidoreductase [Rhizobium sp. VS19-DR121]MBZ5800927.1 FAD-dependent oxidoreductase [Rhizobium sp. VS19-DR181]